MVRNQSVITSKIMSASDVAKYLLDSCEHLQYFECLMFGSSLLGVGSDYDILIIGSDQEALARLKNELKVAGKELPLDILYMLPEEANETEFVVKEKCISLVDLIRL